MAPQATPGARRCSPAGRPRDPCSPLKGPVVFGLQVAKWIRANRRPRKRKRREAEVFEEVGPRGAPPGLRVGCGCTARLPRGSSATSSISPRVLVHSQCAVAGSPAGLLMAPVTRGPGPGVWGSVAWVPQCPLRPCWAPPERGSPKSPTVPGFPGERRSAAPALHP